MTGTLLVGVAAVACGTEGADRAWTVRDSAGVRIAESRSPAWPDGEAWRVVAEPAVIIGEREDDPAATLFGVIGATRLQDGRLVVGNGGSAELRFFDSGGRHLFSVGRAGEGPGEFRALAGLWRGTADSLHAWDRRLGRLTVFDPEGRFVRTVRLAVPAGRIARRVVGRFADGSLVAVGEPGAFLGDAGGRALADPTFVNRFTAAGDFLNPFRSFPGDVWYGFGEGERLEFWMVPFMPEPRWAVAADRLYLGSGRSWEIDVWSVTGVQRAIIRRAASARAVEPGDIRRYGDDLLASAGSAAERRQIDRFLAEVPFPDRFPTYRGLRVDAVGSLWAEQFRRPGETQPRWSVFDDTGRWLGVVETPPGLRVVEIGRDHVLGIARDRLDVERVLLHELQR